MEGGEERGKLVITHKHIINTHTEFVSQTLKVNLDIILQNTIFCGTRNEVKCLLRVTTQFLWYAYHQLQVYAIFTSAFYRPFYFTDQLCYTLDRTRRDPQMCMDWFTCKMMLWKFWKSVDMSLQDTTLKCGFVDRESAVWIIYGAQVPNICGSWVRNI